MTATTLSHLAVVVLVGVGVILLSLFGKIPGTDALIVLTGLGGLSGGAAVASAVGPTAASQPAPTTGKVVT